MTYRDRTQLIYETLNIIAKNPNVTKSRILYAVGLNSIQGEEISNILINNNLVIEKIETLHSKRTYGLTQKGFHTLDLINELNKLINTKQSVEIIL